jgi:O-antigen polysaccharide polymerase Wzy
MSPQRSFPARSTPRGAGSAIVLLACSLVILGLSTLAMTESSTGGSWATGVMITLIAWLVAYAFATYAQFQTVYLFSSAYVIALAVFHFGLLSQYAFGTVEIPSWSGSSAPAIREAGWVAILALACFGIGFALACLVKKVPRQSFAAAAEQSTVARFNLDRLRNLGYGLTIASLLLLVIAFIQLGNILSYSRFELFYQASDTRAIGVFTMLAPSAALALVLTARRTNQKLLSYAFGALVLVMLLLSGYRSVALFPLLVGAVMWVKVGNRIPAYVAATMILTVLAIIPAIGYLRSLGAYEQWTWSDFVESREQARLQDTFSSMGSALGVLAITLDQIPEDEPYRSGRSYLQYLRNSIPNIGTTMSTEGSRGQVMGKAVVSPDALMALAPSDWASLKLIPEGFLLGHGAGFSGIAEPYFNFGFFGIVAFFTGLGFFLCRMDQANVLVSFRWLCFSTLFYWNLVVTVRNDFGVFLKPAIFTLLTIGIWTIARRFLPLTASRSPNHSK